MMWNCHAPWLRVARLGLVGAVLVLLLVLPEAAHAAGPVVADCSAYPGLTVRIVGCVRQTLDNAGALFFVQFYPLVANFVTAILTLGVIGFGVMMALGMVEKIGRDAMVILLKIAFVSYFVQNIDVAYDMILEMMDAMSDTMFTFATVHHPTTPVCLVSKTSVWERLDCLVDTLVGIDVGNALGSAPSANPMVGGVGLARGLVAFFASALFSSVPGFIVGVIGLMFLYTMLIFMVRVLFTFLMAHIALMLLMFLAPLFLPLVIFRTTKQYFDTWVKFIINCALQPVIIVVFVSFAVAALDVVVFSGERSFVRVIAGDAAKANGFNLNSYLEQIGAYNTKTIGPEIIGDSSNQDAANTVNQKGVGGNVLMTKCGLNLPSGGGVGGAVGAAQNCAKGWVVGLNVHSINWDIVAQKRTPQVAVITPKTPEASFMDELMSSAILVAVIVFIMNALMRVVPSIANDLNGSATQTLDLFGQTGKWAGQSQAMDQVSSAIQGMVGGRR